MTGRPTLELVVTGRAPESVVALVRDLATWCEPIGQRPWPRAEPPSARLVWDEARGEVELDGPRGLTTLALSTPLDVASTPAIMPFVRARQRAARGLPAALVLPASAFRGDPAAVSASLAVAAAAVAPADWLARALALATPTVTDAAAAAALGAVHDVHVVIAGVASADDEAAALATDAHRAARLARAGRTLVEHLDRRAVAGRVARELGLFDRPTPDPVATLRGHLRALNEGRP